MDNLLKAVANCTENIANVSMECIGVENLKTHLESGTPRDVIGIPWGSQDLWGVLGISTVPRIPMVGSNGKTVMIPLKTVYGQDTAEGVLDVSEKFVGKTLALGGSPDDVELVFRVPHGADIYSMIYAASVGCMKGRFRTKFASSTPVPSSGIKKLTICVVPEDPPLSVCSLEDVKSVFSNGINVGCNTNLVRVLSDMPAGYLGPEEFAGFAMSRVGLSSGMKCIKVDHKQLMALGAGLITGVAAGSSRPCCLVVIEYDPAPPSGETDEKATTPGGGGGAHVCLVGKGITFDSGGLNLKTVKGMRDMHTDKTGAATVLGVMLSIGSQKKCPHKVTGILCMAENMPSGTAQRPSDVVTAMDGTTVEIENTDAEGRLVMADGICYAKMKLQTPPTHVINVATLTGASLVALGPKRAPFFSNSESMSSAIKRSAKFVGERYWEMPCGEEYAESIKSTVADIMNGSNGNPAGSSTAAAFLRYFAENNSPSLSWAHMDIAGASRSEGKSKSSTGFSTPTLVHMLESKDAFVL